VKVISFEKYRALDLKVKKIWSICSKKFVYSFISWTVYTHVRSL